MAAPSASGARTVSRSEEHTSELQSPCNLVCRLLLEKKKSPCNLVSRIMLETINYHNYQHFRKSNHFHHLDYVNHQLTSVNTHCFIYSINAKSHNIT